MNSVLTKEPGIGNSYFDWSELSRILLEGGDKSPVSATLLKKHTQWQIMLKKSMTETMDVYSENDMNTKILCA
jgi:hypothetical protein